VRRISPVCAGRRPDRADFVRLVMIAGLLKVVWARLKASGDLTVHRRHGPPLS
jgi:hypothetical protein